MYITASTTFVSYRQIASIQKAKVINAAVKSKTICKIFSLALFVQFTRLKPNNSERIISLIPFNFTHLSEYHIFPRKHDMRKGETGLSAPLHLPVGFA